MAPGLTLKKKKLFSARPVYSCVEKNCSLPAQCIRVLYRVFEQTATVFVYSVILLGFIAETEGVTVRYEQNL